ncbi:MAG TPA: YceI family protein [Gaiellaceae bacterium]
MGTVTHAARTLPAGMWNADPVHSHVGFAVDYLVGTFQGSFSPVEASLEVDEKGAGTLRGSVRVENVRVQDENLAAHLQTPDFFDAERAPEITFVARDLRATEADLFVSGELTIKGETQPVELKGTVGEAIADPYGNARLGIELETTIDRTAFGLNWNNPLPSGEPALANDVTLTATLSLVKAA